MDILGSGKQMERQEKENEWSCKRNRRQNVNELSRERAIAKVN